MDSHELEPVGFYVEDQPGRGSSYGVGDPPIAIVEFHIDGRDGGEALIAYEIPIAALLEDCMLSRTREPGSWFGGGIRRRAPCYEPHYVVCCLVSALPDVDWNQAANPMGFSGVQPCPDYPLWYWKGVSLPGLFDWP